MKKFILFTLFAFLSLAVSAQSGKGKAKEKSKDKTEKTEKTDKTDKSDDSDDTDDTDKADKKQKSKKQKTKSPKNKESEIENDDDDNDNDAKGGKQNGNTKTRVNLPTKVKSSFAADYPNAANATWTKNRGDWTVVFGNGAWRSTATYHSNGERVDTRTTLTNEQAPRPVLEEIQKRFPRENPKDIIKIEKPKNPNLFQIIMEQAGKKRTLTFDETGKLVSEQ